MSTPLPDIVQETERIVETAEQKGIVLRLFGGMAIRLHCPSASHRSLQRKYADIDLMGLKKQTKEIRKLFEDLGYAPRARFNAMAAGTRLIFNDIERGRRVDIFLDDFDMCHKFNLKDRLVLNKPTIPLADLLATKLQVVEITEREYRDIIALIHDHGLGDSDAPETINADRIAKLCSDDWGVYKTFTINLCHVKTALAEFELDPEYRDLTRKRLDDLQSRIESAPKGFAWKARARVGEKKRWYNLPEADKEVIDSRMAGER